METSVDIKSPLTGGRVKRGMHNGRRGIESRQILERKGYDHAIVSRLFRYFY